MLQQVLARPARKRPPQPARPVVARASLRQNLLVMAAGQFSTWTITAVTVALLPRYLGAHAFGEYSLANTFGVISVAVFGLGMSILVTKDIARSREDASRLIGTAVWLHLLLGALGGIVSTAIAAATGYSREVVLLVALTGVTTPFALLTNLAYAALQGMEVMRYQAIFDVAAKGLFLVAVAAIIVLDLGLKAFFIVSIPLSVLTTLPLTWRMLHSAGSFDLGFSRSAARHLLIDSLPFFVTNSFFVLYASMDIILLSRLAGETAVGIYSTPMRVFSTLLFGTNVLITVMFPRMAAAFRESPATFQRLSRTTIEIVLAATIPITIAAYGLSDPHIVAVIGHDFDNSGPVLVILGLSLLPTSLNIIANRVLIAADRERLWTVFMVTALAIRAVIAVALIKVFAHAWGNPALGAATALLVAEVLTTGACAFVVPGAIFSRAALPFYEKLTAAALAALAVLLLLREVSPFGAAVAGCLAYLLVAVGLQLFTLRQAKEAMAWFSGRKQEAPAESVPEFVPVMATSTPSAGPEGLSPFLLRPKPNREPGSDGEE